MQMIIKQFSRQELAVLRTEIQSALNHIASKYELSELRLGSISFNPNSFTAKITARTSALHKETVDEFHFFCFRNGLPDKLIGGEFQSEGLHYTIIKIEIRNPKYPVIAQCRENGKRFKFSVMRIKELLTMSPFTSYTIIE